MTISKNSQQPAWQQTELPGLTLSREVYHANRFPLPGSNEARKITGTSGLKCSALCRNLTPLGLLSKMLLVSSVWHSTMCVLTWKPQVTKSNRLLFRLVPQTPRKEGIGSGLWPTPRSCSAMAATITQEAAHALNRFPNLETVVGRRLWPTPNASDNRDRGNLSNPSIQRRILLGKQIGLTMAVKEDSAPGQLNPEWVEWLMGYPLGWTDLKDLETPLSRKSPKS